MAVRDEGMFSRPRRRSNKGMPVVYAKLWLISAADPNEMLRALSGIIGYEIGYMGDPLMSDVIDLFHDAILFLGL